MQTGGRESDGGRGEANVKRREGTELLVGNAPAPKKKEQELRISSTWGAERKGGRSSEDEKMSFAEARGRRTDRQRKILREKKRKICWRVGASSEGLLVLLQTGGEACAATSGKIRKEARLRGKSPKGLRGGRRSLLIWGTTLPYRRKRGTEKYKKGRGGKAANYLRRTQGESEKRKKKREKNKKKADDVRLGTITGATLR